MVARRAIIDPDVRVASFRERIEACELHFFPAPTCGQFGAAGHQQTLEREHGVTTSQEMLFSKVPIERVRVPALPSLSRFHAVAHSRLSARCHCKSRVQGTKGRVVGTEPASKGEQSPL
jgi:hypothetical protein